MGSTLQHVYASNLWQNLGYPLRDPRPDITLGPPYTREGFQIGDVGYVDDHGEFNLVFNVNFPPKELQDPIRQHSIQLVQPVSRQALEPDTVRMSGVRRVPMDPRADYVFTMTSRTGAILVLPDGAFLSELKEKQQLHEFRRLATKCALQWCKFANQDSLYLITAVYKSKSWTLGSFYEGSPPEDIFIRRRTGNDAGNFVYNWQYQSNVDHQQGPGNNRYVNQTVLIKGFKMAVRWDLPIVQRAEGAEGWLSRVFSTLWLTMISWWWLSRINIKYIPTLNFSQPHHPLDIINDVLLEKNPQARVAVTHDDDWIEMLERGLPLADVMQEDHLRAFVVNERNWDLDSKQNAVYLRNDFEGPNNKKDIVRRTKDSVPPRPSNNACLVISNVRLESVEIDRIYAGVCVLIQFENTTRRTTNRRHADVIEWDEEIVLPTDLPIHVTVCGVFQLGSTLGTREISRKQMFHTTDLTGNTHMIMLSMGKAKNCSLLLTINRYFSHFDPSLIRGLAVTWENLLFVENTNLGYDALYSYHEDPKEKYLEDALGCFRRALEQCGPDPSSRASALFNLATCEFIMCQAHGTYSKLDTPIDRYARALSLRHSGHPDRPATLLLQAQALVLSHDAQGQEGPTPLTAITLLLGEIPPDQSRERQTADTIIRTCRLYGTLSSRNLGDLDKLFRDFNNDAYVPPYGYFDRPSMLLKLGIAFLMRFQHHSSCTDLDDLDKSITLNNEALRLIPDGHEHQVKIITHLGVSFLLKRIRSGGKLKDFDLDGALAAITKTKVPMLYVYTLTCDILEGRGNVMEAIECFRRIENELEEETSPFGDRAQWGSNFRSRCGDRIEKLGDDAMSSGHVDVAAAHFSTILSLNPVNRSDILLKRSEARILMRLDEEALRDADEAIRLDPAYYRGYEMRHVTLHNMRRFSEAIEAFDTMLSRMNRYPDLEIKKLRLRYVDARSSIRRIVQETISSMPRVLINPTIGRVYDKEEQAEAFEAHPWYSELVSSMTTPSRLDERYIRIAVKEFYRHMMLTHEWENEDDPRKEMMDV